MFLFLSRAVFLNVITKDALLFGKSEHVYSVLKHGLINGVVNTSVFDSLN